MMSQEETYQYFKDYTDIDWYEWVIFSSEELDSKSLKNAADAFYKAGLMKGVKVMYEFVGILDTIKKICGGEEV